MITFQQMQLLGQKSCFAFTIRCLEKHTDIAGHALCGLGSVEGSACLGPISRAGV